MDDYALVAQRRLVEPQVLRVSAARGRALALEARGQIEGIGTTPRFSAKDGAGAQSSPTTSAGRRGAATGATALDALAAWLRSQLRRRARARRRSPRRARRRRRYAGPTIVTPEVLEDLRALDPAGAAASAAQPRGDRSGVRAAARRAAGRLLRHQLPSRPAGGRRARAAAARDLRAPACSATAFTACRTSTSPRCCRRSRRRSPSGRVIVAHLGSGASMCALKNGKSVDSTMGFTALDGLCMGTRPGALDPGVVLYLFQSLGLSRQRGRDDPLQEVGPARHLRHQQRHARPARRAPSPAPGSPSTTSSIARPRRSARSPRCWAASTRSCSPPASARTRPRSASASREASAWLGIELDDDANARRGPRISAAPSSRVSAWVIPTNEELMIARHTGACWGFYRKTRDKGQGTRENY